MAQALGCPHSGQRFGSTSGAMCASGAGFDLEAPVVQQGQSVMLTSIGNGFSVTAEGKALNNANEGQVVQVKSESGTVVSGIARSGGKVEVRF